MHKVVVSVAQRDGFKGVYALGRLFAHGGQEEILVTDEQLDALRKKAALGLAVAVIGPATPATPAVSEPPPPEPPPEGSALLPAPTPNTKAKK